VATAGENWCHHPGDLMTVSGEILMALDRLGRRALACMTGVGRTRNAFDVTKT
jgi:hypothetical protein